MTRSAARHSHAAQVTQPLPRLVERDAEDSPTSLHSALPTPWYWRLVLFLWGTSFSFLLLYEWLAGLIKAW